MTFIEVLLHIFVRCFHILTGQQQNLYSDELQMLVLFFAGVAGGLLGTFLVLQKMTMVANALSHTILLGIVAVALISGVTVLTDLGMTGFLLAATIAGIVTTSATDFLVRVIRLQKDASIGFVFSALFAIGILSVTLLFRNTHLGVELIMGNIDAVTPKDLFLLLGCAGGVIALVVLLYYPLKIMTFDVLFAQGIGIKVRLIQRILMLMTSIAAVASFRVVGVFLFLSFIVTPMLTVRLFCHSLKHILFLHIGLSALFSICSVALSRHILSVYMVPVSTSGVFVTLSGLCYISALCIKNSRLQRITNRGILPVHE